MTKPKLTGPKGSVFKAMAVGKPQFSIAGGWSNPDRIAPFFSELSAALPTGSKFTAEMRESFLLGVSHSVDFCEHLATDTPASMARNAAQDVSRAVTRLQRELTHLHREGQERYDHVFMEWAYENQREAFYRIADFSSCKRDGHAFLSKLWDDLQTLNATCEQLANATDADTRNQPAKRHALRLAIEVAKQWRKHFHVEPAADRNDASKTSFTKFLRALATVLRRNAIGEAQRALYSTKFSIGPTIAAEAVASTVEGG